MNKDNSKIYLLVLLGLLTAFGPFVTDMYLPTLPAMTDFFHTSSSMVQMGLTTSMIGLAAGQLLFGPLSDKYGRRTPLLTAMWLFIGSTLLCIFASDIRQFVTARFLQGIAGSGGIVISRSVATDRFGGRDLARDAGADRRRQRRGSGRRPHHRRHPHRLYRLAGHLLHPADAGMRPARRLFPPPRVAPGRTPQRRSLGRHFPQFRHRAPQPPLRGLRPADGFRPGRLFAYIASSPFIMQGHYGFSAFEFSICFAVNAVAIGSAAAFSIRFRNPERSTRAGCMGMLLFAAAEAVALGLGCGFWVYEGLLFGLLFAMGLTFTSSTALAMGAAREYAGTASAMLGAICFSFGGIVSPLVGIGDTLLSTGAVFIVCALCSWLSLRIAPRHTAFAAA